jgi:hypothetical protein
VQNQKAKLPDGLDIHEHDRTLKLGTPLKSGEENLPHQLRAAIEASIQEPNNPKRYSPSTTRVSHLPFFFFLFFFYKSGESAAAAAFFTI